MELTIALYIAVWSWVALAAFGIVITGLTAIQSFRYSGGIMFDLVVILFPSASAGLLFLGLSAVGLSTPAIWAWRILAALSMLLGMGILWKALVGVRLVQEILSLISAVTFGTLLLILAFIVRPPIPSVHPNNFKGATLQKLWEIQRVQFWQNVALAIFGTAVVLFLVLFISALQRRNSLQIESHWGGLGGGLGGWRVSRSLSYLAASLAFGVLFTVFVLRLEMLPQAELGNAPQRTTQAAESPPPAKPVVTENTSGSRTEDKNEPGQQVPK